MNKKKICKKGKMWRLPMMKYETKKIDKNWKPKIKYFPDFTCRKKRNDYDIVLSTMDLLSTGTINIEEE